MPKYNVSMAIVEIEAEDPEEALHKFQHDPSVKRIVLVESPEGSTDFSDIHEFELA